MRVLFVGLGGIGQRHARNLRSLLGPRAQFSAVRARGFGRTLTDRLEVVPDQDVERALEIRRVPDLDAGLAGRPDVVVIANPSSMHLASALAAVRAGCHVFIEKPLSDSLDGVEELVETIERQRLVGCVGYQLRFHPCFQLMQEAIDAGRIGRVLAARIEVGEHLPSWHAYEDYRQMYASRRALGGGVILSQIHEFDYLYRLFGMPKRVWSVGGHLSRLELDVEDTASSLLEFDGGDGRFPVHLHQDYVQRPPSRACQIIGDAGKLLADFTTPSYRRFDADGRLAEERAFPEFARNQLFIDEMTHVLACLAGKARPLVSIRDGAQSLRMALAARQSLETGQIVELDAMRSLAA